MQHVEPRQPNFPAAPSTPRVHVNALPVGTTLGEFEIVDLVGEGGFGIVYLAQDHSLHRKVAIKEYMPALLASRGHDASVSVRSERQRETFDLGMRSFVNEARMLARFDHPALIKVYRFWEANGTAYMVMPFLTGQTLQDVLRQRGEPPGEDWIRELLGPLMDALAVLHNDQIYHRDIAPDNIMLVPGDRPVLLDFGAARRVISDKSHSLTVILKPGYAPIEQYADRPGMKQGPWTDVYALAAVVYFMILGRKPPAAVGRVVDDSYEPLARSEAAGRYSARLLEGIDRCLAIRPEDRPQSMAAMREAIGFAAPPLAVRAPPAAQRTPAFHATPAVRTTPKVEPAEIDETTVVDKRVAPEPEAGAEPAEEQVHFPQLRSDNVPRPAAKRSRTPMVAGSVLALAIVAAGAAYYASHRTPVDTAPAGAQAAAPQAAPPLADAATTPAVAVPMPAAQPRITSLASAIDAALVTADPRLVMTLQAPARVPAGSDLSLSVHTNAEGVLYVFAWDQATEKVHRLVAEGKDGGTPIKADGRLTLTYRNAAGGAVNDIPGRLLVIAMLSEKPRDFSTTAFGRDGATVVERAALENQLAAGGLSSLFGTAPCAAGESCQDRFAVALADVARQAAAPVAVVAKRAPAAKPVTQNAPAQAAPRKKSNESEREYMKKLDKDLDSLLGK